jgi:PAS domain-containing protein
VVQKLRDIKPLSYAIAAGVAAALLIGLLSARALLRASDLQEQLNRGYALQTATRDLTPLIAAGPGEALDAAVRQLVQVAELGFTFLAVRDSGGTILATEGRFERLAVPLLTQIGRQELRAWLYSITSERGRFALIRDGQQVGEVEFAHAPAFARDVRESAIRELRIAAWIGLLLALPTLLALGLVVLRKPVRTDPRLLARGKPVERIEHEQTDEADDSALTEVADLVQEHGLHALDSLKRGLIVVDREARIRFMNRTAAEITGWSADDARGRLVYSVFH